MATVASEQLEDCFGRQFIGEPVGCPVELESPHVLVRDEQRLLLGRQALALMFAQLLSRGPATVRAETETVSPDMSGMARATTDTFSDAIARCRAPTAG